MGALDALKLFLRDPLADSSLSTVEATLRQAVTVEQMSRLVALGPVLYEVVVKTRLRTAEMAIRADSSKSARDVLNDAGTYSQEELGLWYDFRSIELFGRCLCSACRDLTILLPLCLQGETQGSSDIAGPGAGDL